MFPVSFSFEYVSTNPTTVSGTLTPSHQAETVHVLLRAVCTKRLQLGIMGQPQILPSKPTLASPAMDRFVTIWYIERAENMWWAKHIGQQNTHNDWCCGTSCLMLPVKKDQKGVVLGKFMKSPSSMVVQNLYPLNLRLRLGFKRRKVSLRVGSEWPRTTQLFVCSTHSPSAHPISLRVRLCRLLGLLPCLGSDGWK